MKTNKILMALALPALFAACTADEFEQVAVQQNSLAGRALLDPNFAVNVSEGAESRFAWDNMVWKFEAGDQFGAAVVDVKELGTVEDGQMLGNYIFAKNEAGEWKTTSQMSEGTYLYYSFNGFEKKSSREPIAFDFTGQKANLAKADAELNKYENQLFISPLYKLVSEYSEEKLPLTFYSYAGVAAFPMTNKSGQDLKITQIILKNGAEMIVKGAVKPSELGAAQYEYYADSAKYIPSAAVTLLKAAKNSGTTADAEAVDACYTSAKNAIYNNKLAQELTKDGKKSEYITLDCQNYVLKNGESKVAYMMVPAGMTGMSVEIKVVDEEGNAWSVYVQQDAKDETISGEERSSIEVTNMSSIVTKRDKTNAIFGKTTDNKSMKYIKITEDNLMNGTGYYVDSKAALLELLDANLGAISVYNSGDWAIDAEIVEAILNYTGAGITFNNDIKLKSSTALTEENELRLENVTFKNLTVVGTEYAADNETVTFAGTTAELNVVVNDKLTIEAGANVTIVGGTYDEIENKGTLSVNASVENADIETSNVLNLKDVNDAASIKLLAGTLNYKTAKTANDTPWTIDNENLTVALTGQAEIIVDANIALTYKAAGALKAGDYKASLTNNGKITIAKSDLTVYGTLTNNGEIVSDNMALFLEGNSTNAADAVIEVVHFINKGVMTNNGYLFAHATTTFGNKNHGTITTGSGSKTYITKQGDATLPVGQINNSAKAMVSVAGVNQVVYLKYSNVTATELAAVDFTTYSINALRIAAEGKFTQDKAFTDIEDSKIADKAGLYALKSLILENNASIEIPANVAAGSNFEQIVLEGSASVSGWDKTKSTLTFTKAATLVVNKATTANVLTLRDVTLSGQNVTVDAITPATAGTYKDAEVKMVQSEWGNLKTGDKLTDAKVLGN